MNGCKVIITIKKEIGHEITEGIHTCKKASICDGSLSQENVNTAADVSRPNQLSYDNE